MSVIIVGEHLGDDCYFRDPKASWTYLGGKMAVKTVGYIGLGNAGAIMASCLPKAGFDLIVRDAEREREEAFVKKNKNSRVAKYSQDGFQDAEVIITMLPNGQIVRDVMLGEKGYARGLKACMHYSASLVRERRV